MEVKVLIGKGNLKLYFGTLPGYNEYMIGFPMMMGPSGTMTGGGAVRHVYSTYIIKDEEGNLKAIKNEKNKFAKSMEIMVGKNAKLLERIEKKELRFKDTEKIIKTYNQGVSDVD